MKYKREKNIAFCSSSKELESDISYFIKVVDLYSAIEVHPNYWLTDKEKMFFACTCLCVNSGECSIVSPDSMDIFRKYFRNNVKKPELHRYFTTLKEKGWLSRNPKSNCIILPVLFEEIVSSGDKMSFEVDISLVKHETDRQDLGRINE